MVDSEIGAATDIYSLFSTALNTAEIDAGLAGVMIRLLREAESAEDATGSPTFLPFLACEVAGGDARQALAVAAACRGLHVASKLIDDVEDGDADRLCLGPGASARLVNLATGLYAASILCLTHLPIALYRDLAPLFHRVILRMVGGQHRELEMGEGRSVDECLTTIGEKAGSFFALGAEAGARCATKDDTVIAALREFGYNAGVVVQLADDLEGFRESGPNGDLANGRRKLPVVYGLSVATDSERRELEHLLGRAREDLEAEAEARRLMSGIGAETYMALQIARHRRRALNALAGDHDPHVRLQEWLHALATCADEVAAEPE